MKLLSRLTLVAALVCTVTGCNATDSDKVGILSIGESAEVPGGSRETDSVVKVTVTSMEEAPAEVLSQFQDGTVLWFVESTFQLVEGDLGQTYDWISPWTQMHGYLLDGSYYDGFGVGGDMGDCWSSDLGLKKQMALIDAYAAGEEVEVCVPVFSDADAPALTGAVFGLGSSNHPGVAWRR